MAYSNSTIEQQPLYPQLPVGQEIICVVSNSSLVANETKVKFCAEVHISSTTPPNLNIPTHKIGTFKTTPNNAGVGMFDFRNIIENYVSADNLASNGSSYKNNQVNYEDPRPLHLVDKYSLSNNSTKYMQIRFYVEYLGGNPALASTVVGRAPGTDTDSDLFTLFNGYLKYTDVLTMGAGTTASDFGYNLGKFNLSSSSDDFLTNAPKSQTCNVNDYGTISFLAPNDNVEYFSLRYSNAAGVSLGSETVDRDLANGAYDVFTSDVSNQLIHFGCFPGNLQNWPSTFSSSLVVDNIEGGAITLQAFSSTQAISEIYTINVNCPDTKGYESIRLCWLNQWGAWDYYTFTKKSVRSLTTQGTTYNQLEGSWNESKYRINSYKGGKKAFRVNSTERISMNTDFVSADFNITFEELINSPEVYMLDGYQTDSVGSALNQYVTPVRLTTSSFTKKTIANDKLIQYTFEVEKSKTLRTQAV